MKTNNFRKKIIRCILVLAIFLPWPVRRLIMVYLMNYDIHPKSRIGISWVYPNVLIMRENSNIGHFTVCKNLEHLEVGSGGSIGNLNWISAYPKGGGDYYADQKERYPSLILGEHSAITHRHLIDCTDSISIGRFSIIAGFRSQILTHSVSIEECKQYSAPVKIGDFCFVGSASLLLGGSILPNYCVLGAKSLLNKKFDESRCLYGGVPARLIKRYTKDYMFFNRKTGHVS